MWARVIEVMLACWLAISPFILRHPSDAVHLWINDLACAGLIATASLLSFVRPLRRAHLFNFAPAFWLLAIALISVNWLTKPAGQNYMVLGFLLAMLAILPSRSAQPPPAWNDYLRRKAASRSNPNDTNT